MLLNERGLSQESCIAICYPMVSCSNQLLIKNKRENNEDFTMIFYETYVSLILDAPNAKGGCIIKEAENNISDKTEIVMNEIDAKKILYNQTDTVTQETQ